MAPDVTKGNAAGSGAAPARPTADEVGKRSFGREQVVGALKAHFPSFSHQALDRKQGDATELKLRLLGLLEGGDGGLPLAAAGAGCGAASKAARVAGGGGGGGAANKAARVAARPHAAEHEDAVATQQRASAAAASAALVRAFTAGAEDMTFSVRLVLDAKAWALPKGLESLRTIARNYEQARDAVAGTGLMPHKLHRTVLPCAHEPDADKQQAMFVALKADLDHKTDAAKALRRHQTGAEGAVARDKHAPDPVLVAMGEDGRDRALWEYYKASARKPPAWGKRALMRFDATSYVGQLHAVLVQGLGPSQVGACKQLQTARKLRDFIVDWCYFWKNTCPPFLGVGDKKDWVYDQWEELPMHSMEVEGLCTLPSDPWAPSDVGCDGAQGEGEDGEGDEDLEGLETGDGADNDVEIDDTSHNYSDERAWVRQQQLNAQAR